MSPLPMLSGILGLPALDAHQVQEQFDRVDAVVIGLPWDGGTTGLPGQRHGPEIVRKFSPNLGFSLDAESRLQGVRDPVSGAKLLGDRRIFDLGDLGGVPIDPRLDRLTYYRAVEDTALRAAQLATVSVFLGGDHSVSAATIVGLSKALGEPLRLVCFDAYCDVGPVAQEVDSYEQLTHANFLSYLASVPAVSSVDVVGVRAALPDSHFPLQLLSRLTRDGTLFTYIDYGNSRTTSPLEGGINNGIRHVLRAHRGMTEDHMKRAAEWFLTLREIPLERAHELTQPPRPVHDPDTDADDNATPEPNLYDTGLSAEEGLWARSGWAGRA